MESSPRSQPRAAAFARNLRSASIIAPLLACPPAQAQWLTHEDPQPANSPFHQDPPYHWVHYDRHYGEPGHSAYPGVWNLPNSWPGEGTTVTVRHDVVLNNDPYFPDGDPAHPVEPFPGGEPAGAGATRGILLLSVLNLEPGSVVRSSIQELSFNGISVWSGGVIHGGGGSNPFGIVHNQGQLSVTGPVTLARNGASSMLNTEHMQISSLFGIEAGSFLRNLSGELPDDSVAEIVLAGPDSEIVQSNGGGGPAGWVDNLGVLRKTGSGNSTVFLRIDNHAESPRNRAGTIAVDSGTLTLTPNAPSTFYGLKAEIATGSHLILKGQTRFENGDTTVSGGGVLRLLPLPGHAYEAVTGSAPTLSAPEGSLECAGAEMRRFINQGSINITAPSRWTDMKNLGHIRMLSDLQIITGLQNGSSSDHDAVLDLDESSNIVQFSSPLENHALLRKKGAGVSGIGGNLNVHGSADPLAGRIEVQAGTLQFPNAVTYLNGGRMKIANGAVADLLAGNFLDGGILTINGSGKVYLKPGSSFRPLIAANPGVLDAAPGVFELRGGVFCGPATNAGELTVSAPTIFNRIASVDSPVTNSGTIHLTATSAGAGSSIDLQALVRLVCTPTSVLSFDIAGRPAQNDQWPRLIDNTTQAPVAYGGTLRVNFGDFAAAGGDRWHIIQCASGINTGDFSHVEFTNVPAGFTPVFEKVANGIRVGLNAAATPPPTYSAWVATRNFPTPADGAFEFDFDGDGLPNGMEYALGTDPKLATAPVSTLLKVERGGDEFLAIRFKRPGGPNRVSGVQWIGEGSDDLGTWDSDRAVIEYGPLDGQGMESVALRHASPIGFKPREFVRLRLVQAP